MLEKLKKTGFLLCVFWDYSLFELWENEHMDAKWQSVQCITMIKIFLWVCELLTQLSAE